MAIKHRISCKIIDILVPVSYQFSVKNKATASTFLMQRQLNHRKKSLRTFFYGKIITVCRGKKISNFFGNKFTKLFLTQVNFNIILDLSSFKKGSWKSTWIKTSYVKLVVTIFILVFYHSFNLRLEKVISKSLLLQQPTNPKRCEASFLLLLLPKKFKGVWEIFFTFSRSAFIEAIFCCLCVKIYP